MFLQLPKKHFCFPRKWKSPGLLSGASPCAHCSEVLLFTAEEHLCFAVSFCCFHGFRNSFQTVRRAVQSDMDVAFSKFAYMVLSADGPRKR